MTIARVISWVSTFYRKFVHEGLPIALASAIGTLLVSQYTSHQSLPAPLPAATTFNLIEAASPFTGPTDRHRKLKMRLHQLQHILREI